MTESQANSWTPDKPIVAIKDVHKSFGDLEVLKGVSLNVMKGEVMATMAIIAGILCIFLGNW